MTIELDHTIVPSHDAVASARRLGELLGVPWSAHGIDALPSRFFHLGRAAPRRGDRLRQ